MWGVFPLNTQKIEFRNPVYTWTTEKSTPSKFIKCYNLIPPLGSRKGLKYPSGQQAIPITCMYSHISIRMSFSCSDRGEGRDTPGIYSVSCISVVRSACKFTAGKHSGFQHRSCAWIDPPQDSNIWDAFISLDKHW